MKEVIESLTSLVSRAINSFCYGGNVSISTSARAYSESFFDPVWKARAERIDKIARWVPKILGGGPDHCKEAWDWEVENSRKTIEQDRLINEVRGIHS